MSTCERAMRVFQYVEHHPYVRSRARERSLFHGQHAALAEQVAEKFECSRATSARMVRFALDVLGFGDPDRSRNESRIPERRMTRPGARWAL